MAERVRVVLVRDRIPARGRGLFGAAVSTPGDWRREMRAEAARVVLLHTPVDGVCFGCLVESGKVTRWPCLPRHEWVRVAHVMRPQNP